MTIRRDIKRLERDGFLRQAYGGATVHLTKSVELGFNSRALHFAHEKRLIGARAAQMIQPGQTLFVGTGTTTAQLVQFMPPQPHLRVVTASLTHASLLASRGIHVVVIGGTLHPDELYMMGSFAQGMVASFYADICVIGAAGIDADVGVTEIDYELAALHRTMLERSRQVVVLADHSKIGFRASAVVAPAAAIACLVTDETASDAAASLRASGIDLVLSGEEIGGPNERPSAAMATSL